MDEAPQITKQSLSSLRPLNNNLRLPKALCARVKEPKTVTGFLNGLCGFMAITYICI